MNSKTLSQVKSSNVQEIKSIEVESDNLNYSQTKNEKDEIYVLINKNTEKLMDSRNKTDLIQCALEYNSFLIENLIKEKNNLSKLENDAALNRLYENLNVLTESFELYEKKYKLINSNGKNYSKDNNDKNNKEINKNNEEQYISDTDRLYKNSITNIKSSLNLKK